MTGKSKIIVDYIVNAALRLTLIVCPKSVIGVWPDQFLEHAARPVEVLTLKKGTPATRFRAARRRIAHAADTDRPLVLVANYEAVWRKPLASLLLETSWDMIVCDESHRIKSARSRVSRFMGLMHHETPRRVCLTGTPLESPLDAWAQFRFLDPRVFGRSFIAFRNRYAIMGGFEGRQVVGFRNQEEFRARFASITHRVRKDDVLDLPTVLHQTRLVELSATAKRIYDALDRDLRADVVNGTVTAANGLVRLLRLQQATSGFASVTRASDRGDIKTEETIDTAKADALADILEDLPGSEPVIVFVWFRHDLDVVHAQAAKRSRTSFELSGRRNELAAWQQAAGGEVLAIQIKAGGLGVSLTRSRYCVYMSLNFSAIDYEQSLGRSHRPGQVRHVTYIHLVANGTIDQKVYKALKRKKKIVDYVLSTFQEGDQHA